MTTTTTKRQSPPKDAESSKDQRIIKDLMNDMDWPSKIGQMSQIEIGLLLTEDKRHLKQDLVDHYIGELGIGSVLNTISLAAPGDHFWTVAEFRQASIQIQETAKKYNRPPVLWGLDSVHGANYLLGKIMTPQPFNLAASFNTTLAYEAGARASHDTRQAGIQWLFSPLVGIAWNSYWSRIYETFGEDPYLVGEMATRMTLGIQQFDQDSTTTSTGGGGGGTGSIIPSRAAACAKHWVGYSFPRNGHDRAPSWIPRRHLFQYFIPPWSKVFQQARVETVMESYTEIDGVPNVANRFTLDYLLRRRLSFEGVVVTDYHEIFNLAEFHGVAQDRTNAVLQSMQEGTVDMSMIPWNAEDYRKAIESNLSGGENDIGGSAGGKKQVITRDRINKSVERILKLKLQLNMFEETITMDNGGIIPGANTPTEEELSRALEMTRQTIILAKNSGQTLPLQHRQANNKKLKVLVTGPTSSSLSYQTGGWSGQWQGIDPSHEDNWYTYGSTVIQAAMQQPEWDVSYQCGVSVTGGDCGDNDSTDQTVVDKVKSWVGWGDREDPSAYYSIEKAVAKASDVDLVIVCIGEENYTEKPGDIRSLRLPQGQSQLVEGLRQTSNARIVLVYFGGRPRLLESMVDNADAVLLAFLPGPLAGEALMDIIKGKVNPSAKLPITYPKFEDGGGIPYMHSLSDMCTKGDVSQPLPHYENFPCQVQWSFGHGLSYATFEYSNLEVSSTTLKSRRGKRGERTEDDLTVSVTVQNSGSLAGSEVALFFTFDEFRSTTPEYKRLRGFNKFWLQPGTGTRINVTIPMADLRFVGPHDDTHYILQDGLSFRVGVGSNTDCRSESTGGSSVCSPVITIKTENDYVGACEAACDIWRASGCADYHDMAPDLCWDMCTSIHADSSLQMNNDGWGWHYVSCLEDIVSGGSFAEDPTQCWKMTSLCRDVFGTAHMDVFGNGVAMRPPQPTNERAPDIASIALGALVGAIVSVVIYYGVRGGFSKREEDPFGDVQFTVVPDREDPTAPETELT